MLICLYLWQSVAKEEATMAPETVERHLIQEYLAVAKEASEAGCVVLRKHWGNLKGFDHKTSSSDLVTIADKESETAVLAIIKAKYPDHAIVAEESGLHESRNSEFMWVIDPLDGTTNYTHQYPFVCVSIGLLHKGESIVGVVQNPIMEECFWGAKGMGAYLNDKKISVSNADQVKDSLLVTGFRYDRRTNPDNNYREFCHLTNISHGVRRSGAAALDMCYVACGRVDAYWEQGVSLWDVAAGDVIVKEAGGSITDYDGTPANLEIGRLLATNGHVHAAMCDELLSIRGA